MNIIIAEFIGTFCLVFAGCGAIVADSLFGGVTHVGIAMTFGLVVMAMIYSVGNISGAHLNPAVTVGFCAARRLPWSAVPRYFAGQFLGGIAAAALLAVIYAGNSTGTLGSTLPVNGVLQAFFMEVVLSFILMFVILNVSTGHKEKGIMAGVAVGGTVALDALFGGPVSGASMNPARSLGPALASGTFEHLWIYMTAPVVGTLLASPWCRIVQGAECCYVPSDATDGSCTTE